MSLQKIVVIAGPTAVGKTEVAIKLAKKLNGAVISADSMQIYRELQIGTARPSEEELQGVPHYLMGCVAPNEKYSAARFQKDAFRAIDEIAKKGMLPIVAGGTGLYVNALTHDINFDAPETNPKIRERLEREYDLLGGEELHRRLQEKDSAAAQRVHWNDRVRVVRALELAELGGRSAYRFRAPNETYDFHMFVLTKPRAILYRDIDCRVGRMFQNGLVEEVTQIYKKYGKEIGAFAAIGYKEFLPYFSGETDLAQVAEIIAKNTRHFAKRQLTWFRADPRYRWLNVSDFDCAASVSYAIINTLNT